MSSATVDVIGKCQNRCVFCYNKPSQRASRIELDAFKKIVESMPLLQKIKIGGGEPFLHLNIVDILRFCIMKGLKTGVSSNGIFIPDNVMDLIRKNEISLQINVPAAQESAYYMITGNAGAFPVVIENLRKFQGLPNVQMRLTLCRENASQLRPIAELSYSLGLPLVVSLFIPFKWNSATPLDRTAVADAHFLITTLALEGKHIDASWGIDSTVCPRVAQVYGLVLRNEGNSTKGNAKDGNVRKCTLGTGTGIYVMPNGKQKGCEFLDG